MFYVDEERKNQDQIELNFSTGFELSISLALRFTFYKTARGNNSYFLNFQPTVF